MVNVITILNRKSYLAIYEEKPQNPTTSYLEISANYRKKVSENKGLGRAKHGPSVLLVRPCRGSLR